MTYEQQVKNEKLISRLVRDHEFIADMAIKLTQNCEKFRKEAQILTHSLNSKNRIKIFINFLYLRIFFYENRDLKSRLEETEQQHQYIKCRYKFSQQWINQEIILREKAEQERDEFKQIVQLCSELMENDTYNAVITPRLGVDLPDSDVASNYSEQSEKVEIIRQKMKKANIKNRNSLGNDLSFDDSADLLSISHNKKPKNNPYPSGRAQPDIEKMLDQKMESEKVELTEIKRADEPVRIEKPVSYRRRSSREHRLSTQRAIPTIEVDNFAEVAVEIDDMTAKDSHIETDTSDSTCDKGKSKKRRSIFQKTSSYITKNLSEINTPIYI